MSQRDQAIFSKRLSLLLKAELPLLESLEILKDQGSKGEKIILENLISDVSLGKSFNKCLEKHQNIFGSFAINIVKIGESTGSLPENLQYLYEEIEKKRELKSKIISALIYPLIIVMAAFGMAGFLTLYLFPKLTPVFKSLKVNLPFTTKILIWASDFLIKYWLWLLCLSVLASIVLIFYWKKPRFQLTRERIIFSLPIISEVFKYYYLANLCRTIGLLLKGSLRIIESIEIAAETTVSPIYKMEIAKLALSTTKGLSLSKHLEKNPKLFPSVLTGMISISERTGNMPETFIHLSNMYDQELGEKTKRLSSLIEPVVMLVMGFVVGFIAISIITPIYEITQKV